MLKLKKEMHIFDKKLLFVRTHRLFDVQMIQWNMKHVLLFSVVIAITLKKRKNHFNK